MTKPLLTLLPGKGPVEVAGIRWALPSHTDARKYALVSVDLPAFDRAYRAADVTGHYYIPKDGSRNTIGDRYQRFQTFLQETDLGKKRPIHPPHVGVGAEGPSLGDGRHRFAVFHAWGLPRVVLEVSRGQVKALERWLQPALKGPNKTQDQDLDLWEAFWDGPVIVVSHRENEGTRGNATLGSARQVQTLVVDQARGSRYDGAPIGKPTDLPISGKVGFIEDVEVSKKHRWEGWGRKLYERLAQELYAKGAQSLVLLATDESRAFWRHMGFQVVSWEAGSLIPMVRSRGTTERLPVKRVPPRGLLLEAVKYQREVLGHKYQRAAGLLEILDRLDGALTKGQDKKIESATREIHSYITQATGWGDNPVEEAAYQAVYDFAMQARRQVSPRYSTEAVDAAITYFKHLISQLEGSPGVLPEVVEILQNTRGLLQDTSPVGLFEQTEFPTVQGEVTWALKQAKTKLNQGAFGTFLKGTRMGPLLEAVGKIKKLEIGVNPMVQSRGKGTTERLPVKASDPADSEGYPFLPLATVWVHLPAMVAQGVSEVARSPRGFLTAYQSAKTQRGLSAAWLRQRAAFITRHMAQVQIREQTLFTTKGEPTRRHLALIAWAYSPFPDHIAQGRK